MRPVTRSCRASSARALCDCGVSVRVALGVRDGVGRRSGSSATPDDQGGVGEWCGGYCGGRVGALHDVLGRPGWRRGSATMKIALLGTGFDQALVIPALSLSITWAMVKLAGVCDGGN